MQQCIVKFTLSSLTYHIIIILKLLQHKYNVQRDTHFCFPCFSQLK